MKRLDDRASDHAIRFVVGTKVDLENARRVQSVDGQKFANENGYRFCEVSSKSGRNINQIFTTVALYVIQHKVVEKFDELAIQPIISADDALYSLSPSLPRMQKKKRGFCCQSSDTKIVNHQSPKGLSHILDVALLRELQKLLFPQIL